MGFRAVDPDVLRHYLDQAGLLQNQNGRSFILRCPRCSKLKLYMRKSDGRFACWVCRSDGFEGEAHRALAELVGLPVEVVEQELFGTVKVEEVIQDGLVDHWEEAKRREQPVPTRPWPEWAVPIDHPWAERGRRYLEGRGIPLEVAARYGARYFPCAWSIAWPITTPQGLAGWQTRLTVPNREWSELEGRWLETSKSLTYPAGLPVSRLLMFQDRLVGSRHAVLCEGPIDAVKADLCGGNVCTFGKGVTAQQVDLVLGAGVERIYLALDEDAAHEAVALARRLAGRVEVRWMVPEGRGRDLGDMAPQEVRELFDRAPPVAGERIAGWLEPPYPHISANSSSGVG